MQCGEPYLKVVPVWFRDAEQFADHGYRQRKSEAIDQVEDCVAARLEVVQQSVILGVYLLDEFGDEPGGAGRTVGLDVEVADGLADQFSDFGGDQVGFGGCVVHAMAGAVAG